MARYLDRGWVVALACAATFVLGVVLQQRVMPAFASTLGMGMLVAPKAALALAALPFAAVLALALAAPTAITAFGARVLALAPARASRLLAALAVLSLVGPWVIADGFLDRFPNSSDEFSNLFQSAVLARGSLWADAPPLDYSFVAFRTWINGAKWVGQHPPGWPLVLAGGAVAQIPAWMVNGLIGLASVAVLASPLWRGSSRNVSLVVVALYVVSPFYQFQAASFHSHMLTALLVALACLCCLWYERDGRALALLAAGAALGLIGMTRYFSLVLLLPAIGFWLVGLKGARRAKAFAVIAAGGLPFLAFLLHYHRTVVGAYFRTTYSLIEFDEALLAFDAASLVRAVGMNFYRLLELGVWTSSVLPLIYLACLAAKLRARSFAFHDLVAPTFVAGFILFGDLGGNRYGPRYWFDAYPLMMVTIATGWPLLVNGAATGMARALGAGAIVVTMVFQLACLPVAAVTFRNQVHERREPFEMVRRQGLANAVVILRRTEDMWPLDLVRNDAGLAASVLYARPATPVAELHALYPARSIWIFESAWRGRPARLYRADGG